MVVIWFALIVWDIFDASVWDNIVIAEALWNTLNNYIVLKHGLTKFDI